MRIPRHTSFRRFITVALVNAGHRAPYGCGRPMAGSRDIAQREGSSPYVA
jgi:hypothetical protein